MARPSPFQSIGVSRYDAIVLSLGEGNETALQSRRSNR